jgi:hypothetical protein
MSVSEMGKTYSGFTYPRDSSILVDNTTVEEHKEKWVTTEKTTEYKFKTPFFEVSRKTKKVPKDHVKQAETMR